MKIVVIKYNAGNIRSVSIALERIGADAIVSDDAETIRSADKVIFPGVGEASSAMKYLKEKNLSGLIPQLKQPVLGICLGMQLLCSRSEEGNTSCMNVFNLEVKKFEGSMKVPQIGWNNIFDLKGKLMDGVKENEFMYFVHGYYVPACDLTIAKTDYGCVYSAALEKDNFYAAQFHPEKSSNAGQKILQNFLAL